MARQAVLTDEKSIREIVKLRNNESLKWAEIAERYGVSEGKVMFAFMVGTAEPMKTVTPKTIAAARQSGQSWGLIAARAGISEGAARKMFEEATGENALGQRIGRGGRHPGSTNGSAPAKKATGAAKATKAPAKKAVTGKGGKLKDLIVNGTATLEQVQAGLGGKTVRVERNGKTEEISVAEVTKVTKGVITVKDSGTGRSRAIKAETITGVR